MKQRTTFLLKSLESIDTDNLILNENLVKVPATVFSLRQDRLTVSKDELPDQLKALFENLYMFRVQWASETAKRTQVFQNFGQIGLSVHLIPGTVNYEPIFDDFGSFVDQSFGVSFNSTNVISTATSATFNALREIKSSKFQQFLNAIVPELDRISYVQHFDIIWETSQLKITWTSQPYDSKIVKSDLRKEVALFQALDLYGDLELSGIRTVLDDEYTPPEKTLLIVKPRHTELDEQLQMSLSQPVGLHPELQIKGFSGKKPHPNCDLFIYSTLPNVLFFDKYQYNENKIKLLNSWGENDLEAPAWKVEKFGSAQLFHVLNNTDGIDIKFHSRYIKPSAPNIFKFFIPEVFWACEAETFMEEWDKIEANPFETYNLGYESFFEPSTVFYHYKRNTTDLRFTIPTAEAADHGKVQLITSAVVLIGSLYLLFKLFASFTALNRPSTKKIK